MVRPRGATKSNFPVTESKNSSSSAPAASARNVRSSPRQ